MLSTYFNSSQRRSFRLLKSKVLGRSSVSFSSMYEAGPTNSARLLYGWNPALVVLTPAAAVHAMFNVSINKSENYPKPSPFTKRSASFLSVAQSITSLQMAPDLNAVAAGERFDYSQPGSTGYDIDKTITWNDPNNRKIRVLTIGGGVTGILVRPTQPMLIIRCYLPFSDGISNSEAMRKC